MAKSRKQRNEDLKKKHLHARSVFLSLGLLAVIAFTLILGLFQLNKTQNLKTNASTNYNYYPGPCTLLINKPGLKSTLDGSHTGVFAETDFKCDDTVKAADFKGWISIGHSKNSLNSFSHCPTRNKPCNSHTGFALIPEIKFEKGTHSYCTWAYALWIYKSGQYDVSGYRPGPCLTYTFNPPSSGSSSSSSSGKSSASNNSTLSSCSVSAPCSSACTNTSLARGSQGNAVKAMQTKLVNKGYSMSPYGADGIFGSVTEAAVKSYQSSHGLSADGIVGCNTWGSLCGQNLCH